MLSRSSRSSTNASSIESGSSIQWTGSSRSNAMLDIDAVYKVKASLQPLIRASVSSGGGDLGARPFGSRGVRHSTSSERLSNHPPITFDVRVPTAPIAEYADA